MMIRRLANFYVGTIGLTLAITGCRMGDGICKVDRCADIPCGAIPAPAGSHVCEWQAVQVDSASADQGVFYQSDFVGKTAQLSPSAEQQVARLVEHGALDNLHLVLEPSSDPQRDTDRVYMLASAFSAAGFPMSTGQIQIAHPAALGLDGFRAQQIGRTAARSGNAGGGGTGGRGIGGGGMGGGGIGGGGISGGSGGIF
jgi:uncharacterized membrane protein YgcG